MTDNSDKMEMPADKNKDLKALYAEKLREYRNLLTTKIFEKNEQIKTDFRTFARTNGLSVIAMPDSLEAYDGEKMKLKLTFLTPMADRAQIFLTIYFTSAKEFYLNIYHTFEILPEMFSTEELTMNDITLVESLYNELKFSDVYISYYDKDRITDSREDEKFRSFTEIIDQLYREPRKF